MHRQSAPDYAPTVARTLPPVLALVHVYVGHASLACAAILLWLGSDGVAGSILHPYTLAAVHFVTLGWLTSTAIGATYVVLPTTLRAPMPVRWPDWVASALVWIGASGVVSHMLLGTYSGVAWSGGTACVGFAFVGIRAARALGIARAPLVQRVAVPLAYAFLVVAAMFGACVAIDRDAPIFAGGHLRAIAAHAHIALLGWLAVLVVGVGHRLLPMFVPAAPVEGRGPLVSVLLLALGAITLPICFVVAPWPSRLPLLGAVPVVVAAMRIALDARAMLRVRKPKPIALPRPDPALAAAAIAFACLAAGAGVGVATLALDLDARFVALYGVLVLLGGFGGLVLGIGFRLWPLAGWLRDFHALTRDGATPDRASLPTPPAERASPRLQWIALSAHVVAVLALGIAVTTVRADGSRVAAVALAVAASVSAAHLARVVRGRA